MRSGALRPSPMAILCVARATRSRRCAGRDATASPCPCPRPAPGHPSDSEETSLPKAPPPRPPGRRNPPGRRRRRSADKGSERGTAAAEAHRAELEDEIEFKLARICGETSDRDLTWPEWHAQRALCTLATGKDRDHPCPEACHAGCRYLAALRSGFLADDPDPWWRAWRRAADGLQPAIRAAKRSNR